MSTKEIKFAFVKYSTGEKEIISVDRIKGFNAKSIHYEKKYKILWNEEYYDGIIIFVAESEEILETKIEKDRPRLRPMDQYISASESDAGNKKNDIETKRDHYEKEQLLAKKLKDAYHKQHTINDNNTETKKDNKKKQLSVRMHKESTHNQSNKEVEKLTEVESLRQRIAELLRSLQDKDVIIEDYIKSSFTLLQNVTEEIQELKSIIKEQHEEKIPSREEGTHFPIGHQREIDNNVQIHIGRNIWITSQVYDSVVCINILRYWMDKVKKCDEVTIDLEVNLVGKYISQKIYELNREKKKQTAVNVITKALVNRSTVEEHVDENIDTEVTTNNDVVNISNEGNQDEECDI